MGFLSDHKSSPTGFWAFCVHRVILFTSGHVHQFGSSGLQTLWVGWFFSGWSRAYLETRELNPRSSIYDQREIPWNYFYRWFQKPVICADSWFLESNGKKVQWDFSLIINRAPHGVGLFWPSGYTFYSRSDASTYKFWLTQVGWFVLWLIRSIWRTGIEPAELDLWSERLIITTI